MGARHGRIEIGVGEDDVGALAAQLEGQTLERGGGVGHDLLGRAVLAGEGDLVDAGMPHQRGAGVRPVAGHDVDHAVGEARLLGQVGQPQRGQRRLFGRLEHQRAAGGQRRGPLPGDHQHGEVPGNDLPGHPHRLAAGVAEKVARHAESSARRACRPSRRSSGRCRPRPAGRRSARRGSACRCRGFPGPPVPRSSCWIRSARRNSSRPRSRALIRGQGPCSNASRAARTARSTSSAVPWATSAITSSVAGLMVGKVLPSLAATQRPPIKHSVYLISATVLVSMAVAMIHLQRKRESKNVRQARRRYGPPSHMKNSRGAVVYGACNFRGGASSEYIIPLCLQQRNKFRSYAPDFCRQVENFQAVVGRRVGPAGAGG